jgi:hypothetical protein
MDLPVILKKTVFISLYILQKGDVDVSGFSSKISYTPRTELDFGTLLCLGSNSIGKGTPCMFSILPIGPPDPPSSCLSSNVTYSSSKVRKKSLIINIICICSDIL